MTEHLLGQAETLLQEGQMQSFELEGKTYCWRASAGGITLQAANVRTMARRCTRAY